MANNSSGWKNWSDHPIVVFIITISAIGSLILSCIGIVNHITSKETYQETVIDNTTDQKDSMQSTGTLFALTHTSIVGTEVTTSVTQESLILNCLSSPYADLGDSWTSAPFFTENNNFQSVVFTHCPPQTSIQYLSIAIDDDLEHVEMVCEDENENLDLTTYFHPFDIENEELLHWKSDRIELKQNCRIDFTIADIKGVSVGMQIKKSQP